MPRVKGGASLVVRQTTFYDPRRISSHAGSSSESSVTLQNRSHLLRPITTLLGPKARAEEKKKADERMKERVRRKLVFHCFFFLFTYFIFSSIRDGRRLETATRRSPACERQYPIHDG